MNRRNPFNPHRRIHDQAVGSRHTIPKAAQATPCKFKRRFPSFELADQEAAYQREHANEPASRRRRIEAYQCWHCSRPGAAVFHIGHSRRKP